MDYAHLQPLLRRQNLSYLVRQVVRAVNPVRLRDCNRAETHQAGESGAPQERARRATASQPLRLCGRRLRELLHKLLERDAPAVGRGAEAGAEADGAYGGAAKADDEWQARTPPLAAPRRLRRRRRAEASGGCPLHVSAWVELCEVL
jgi:hypothetical protein